MPTNRVSAGIAASTVASLAEVIVATLNPGAVNPTTTPVLVRADLALIGASSVTSITMRIRRSQVIGGAAVATVAATVTGAVTIPGTIAFEDAAYDGAGYNLTVQAAGAAGTCGPGVFEAQPQAGAF